MFDLYFQQPFRCFNFNTTTDRHTSSFEASRCCRLLSVFGVGISSCLCPMLLFFTLIQQFWTLRRASESSVATGNASSSTIIMTASLLLCTSLYLAPCPSLQQSIPIVSLSISRSVSLWLSVHLAQQRLVWACDATVAALKVHSQ